MRFLPAFAQARVADQLLHRGGQTFRVAGGKAQSLPAVCKQFGGAPRPGDDYRLGTGHRFHNRQSERFRLGAGVNTISGA